MVWEAGVPVYIRALGSLRDTWPVYKNVGNQKLALRSSVPDRRSR